MGDFGEGIGTAAEGSLLARAVEKDSGEASGHTHETNCLNCSASLLGNYCHACGQKAHIHRTIGAFMHDLLHGALHFEGKIWHTLPLLVWQPGKLTRRYIDGERARFVSPMALFLFAVFLMFATFQLVGLSTPAEITPVTSTGKQIEEVRGDIDMQRGNLEARIAALPPGDPERDRLESELTRLGEVDAGIQQVEKFAFAEGASLSVDPDTGIAWIDKGLQKWRANPGLMLYKLQANFYKFSWLLIPLSIPFVWLLFAWKRQFKAYDHAIFVTYSLSFMSLLFIAFALLGLAGLPSGPIFLAAILLPLWHMHRQLKGTYAIGNRAALWRVALLALFIGIVLMLFLQLLVLLGLF